MLTAILIPTASAVRASAAKTIEISAARQLMPAYLLAAQDRRGVLLPSSSFGQNAFSESGQAITGVAARWPHHLRPYLGNRFRATLYINDQVAYYDRFSKDNYRLGIAPSFGLNARFVGGDGALLVDRPITRLNQVHEPASLIAFVATRDRALDPAAGFFTVTAPCYWVGSGTPVYANSNPASDRAYGHVAARWSGHATVAFLDGSVALRSSEDLRDMRLWSAVARQKNDPNYLPAPAH